MKTNLFKSIILIFLAVVTLSALAQDIVLDKELAANSKPMKVKMGASGFGKTAKWKFGEYAVKESKAGVIKSSSKSKIFSAKTESKTNYKFSFIMEDGSSDVAEVNAAKNIEVKAKQSIEIFKGFTVGDDELLLENQNFAATITIDGDTTHTWALLMNTSVGSESKNTGKAILVSPGRKIIIVSASSDKNGTDKRMVPATGFEFIENDRAVSALQLYGGGLLGDNKIMVWIDNRLDPKMKLVLAAAMTSILQMRQNDRTANL